LARARFRADFLGDSLARHDLTGAVDFAYLEDFAAGDAQVIEEVLALFREQAALWSALLDPASEGWRDALHTIKGSARGVGAFTLGEACEQAEREGASALGEVRFALDVALADVAAYLHERALQSLRSPRV
jgi:HPt (histidine-containing phosphotransfer) domain-containing protein